MPPHVSLESHRRSKFGSSSSEPGPCPPDHVAGPFQSDVWIDVTTPASRLYFVEGYPTDGAGNCRALHRPTKVPCISRYVVKPGSGRGSGMAQSYDTTGCGCLVFVLAIAAVVIFSSDWSWSNSIWYAEKYGVNWSDVQTDAKPKECDFLRAPLGYKDCSYTAHVKVFNADGALVAGENAPMYGSDVPRQQSRSFLTTAARPGTGIAEQPSLLQSQNLSECFGSNSSRRGEPICPPADYMAACMLGLSPLGG